MRIGTNITALKGHNNLNKVNEMKAKSFEKLSTGKRINSASDDAAGLAISEKMNSQIRGMKQSVRNAQDGQAMVQTAEGALGEVSDILQRMRELTTQAANDTYSTTERAKIKTEMDELTSQIDDIGKNTKFNGSEIFSGDDVTLQVGANSGETLTINISEIDANSLSIDSLDIGSNTDASDALDAIDAALEEVNTQRATLGSQINRLDCTISNLNTSIENLSSAESRISDVDMAEEMMNMTKNNILSQAANSMLAQSMQAPQSVLQLLG